MRHQSIALTILVLTPLIAFSQTPDTNFELAFSGSTNPPGTVAWLTTTNSYPCEGYRIRTRLTRRQDTLVVNIDGLIRPIPCFQTQSTATGETYLGNFGGGTYYLKLSYRGTADIYELVFDGGLFLVTPLHVQFTTFVGTALHE